MPATAPQATTITAVLFGLRGCLVQPGKGEPRPAPGALDALYALREQKVPCIWLDDADPSKGMHLASVLPHWLPGHAANGSAWPAPNACWQALMWLGSERLEGCVLVSGEPRLLQSALNAGLWTVGLAACGHDGDTPSNDLQRLTAREQELARAKLTLGLFDLGVHSVIDHLDALENCLEDIARRRRTGEKP